jgi:hypothetical protein
MSASSRLLEFFRKEFEAEEQNGFARLARIPDSRVDASIVYFKTSTAIDRLKMIDFCVHWAHKCYSFVIGVPPIDHTRHAFFARWQTIGMSGGLTWQNNVPLLRTAVSQYKIDKRNGKPSSVSEELCQFASSVRSIKAPELRRRVRAALKPLGYYRLDELGYYCCRHNDWEFRVHVDYGGRNAQMRYRVARPEFTTVHPLSQFCFEKALGCGFGDWNFIVEENVDDVFALFAEVVMFSYHLPDRIRAFVG